MEVDPATGVVRILRYVVSEDRGNMINPMVVEGQIAGGVVQGIGGVFYEHMVYDADGNPLPWWGRRHRVPGGAGQRGRDTLAPLGVRVTTQPLTPEKIISLIEAGRPLR